MTDTCVPAFRILQSVLDFQLYPHFSYVHMPAQIFGTEGGEKLLQLLKIISRGTVQVLLIIHATWAKKN